MRWTVVGHPRGPFSPTTVGVFDGVSTFRLDSRGFVYEHAVDNVILRPREGGLKSPLFAGLGLAGLSGGGGVDGRVAVPGGAGGGGGGGGDGLPCPNFTDAPAAAAASSVGAAQQHQAPGEAALAVVAAPAAEAGAADGGRPLPTPDPTRLAAARALLAAAWAASGGGAGAAAPPAPAANTPSILVVCPADGRAVAGAA